MARDTAYQCPRCNADVNAQRWLPTTLNATCASCGCRFVRSGANIRDAWGTSAMIFGYVPLALAIALLAGGPGMSVPGRLLMGFVLALPGAIVLGALGWIAGLIVGLYAPHERREPRQEATEDEALGQTISHGDLGKS
jgi:hypothetical protein